jgi:hypothetical protein
MGSRDQIQKPELRGDLEGLRILARIIAWRLVSENKAQPEASSNGKKDGDK